MISTEKGILPGSDYYVYTPSAQAQSLFFYPLIIGNFSYSDDYSLRRTAFDNFLLMYIKRGEGIIELNDRIPGTSRPDRISRLLSSPCLQKLDALGM